MTMMSRTSSDGSVDGQDSMVSETSTPRRSLDGVAAQNRRQRTSDFSDMPTLSSFRADEMSAVTSSSVASYTSNSKNGDGDMSLPSLASFRLEDLSTCSSFHSVPSTTNHQSEAESTDGWGSFTSGNASRESDSDMGDDESEFATQTSLVADAGESTSDGLHRPVRSISPSLERDPEMPNTTGDSLNANAIPPRRPPGDDEPKSGLPMRRPTRTVSPPVGELIGGSQSADSTGNNALRHQRRSPESPDRSRQLVERSESLPLSVLHSPSKDKSGSSSSSFRTGGEPGSSGSLKGGDSLPRLPRRTITLHDRGPQDEEGKTEDNHSDDESNFSGDDSKLSDGEVTGVSEDDISLNSDVDSDVSIDTDEESESMHDVEKEESSPADVEIQSLNKASHESQQQEDPQVSEGDTNDGETDAGPVEEDTNEQQEVTPAEKKPRKSPTKTEARDPANAKKNPDESGTVSAEESGTSATDTEVEDSDDVDKKKDEENKDGEKKRGKLLRRVSSSVRHSFKMIGRTASKLKMVGARRQPEEPKSTASVKS